MGGTGLSGVVLRGVRQSTGQAATQERLQRGRGGLRRGCSEAAMSCSRALVVVARHRRGGGRSSSSTRVSDGKQSLPERERYSRNELEPLTRLLL
ncbi:hypothetical protein GUJ93_ZPchr0001g29903 [Zizania palustris]|uniref:Uncharacterized protein n=1 Tax=Zizania palustris TaxID=103762 RepID=A0A8J5VLD9_ZIZPA|nr:hypothetical protein GUJ93_ZPchr0001g29903 [Zizania palustris]